MAAFSVKTTISRAATAGLVLAAALALGGCSGTTYSWGWHVVSPLDQRGLNNLIFLASGVWASLLIALVSIVFSVGIGLAVGIAALSKQPWLRTVNRLYVEIFRAVPLLVLLLWVYYGLPVVAGIQFGVFAAGVISLALSDSAFEAEIFRAGIQSIPKGQWEAGRSIGLTSWQVMRLVVLPQAIRRILPALGNQFVYVLKMSSLISVIGYQELTRRANELTLIEYRPLEIYTLLVLEYLALILVVSWLVRKLEQRMAAGDHGS
ncbi:MAG TPA: amino acid ABC transporter permease [Beijerinckiaceae bacterium]|nr:amino acid ABC transporter permease [Beijerinckiaceae bacterium]